jgi:hypothetical protein
MTLQFKDNPHRSLRTVPDPGFAPPQECSIRVTLSLARRELFGFLRRQTYLLPQPQQGFPIPGNSPYQVRADEAAAFLNRATSLDTCPQVLQAKPRLFLRVVLARAQPGAYGGLD